MKAAAVPIENQIIFYLSTGFLCTSRVPLACPWHRLKFYSGCDMNCSAPVFPFSFFWHLPPLQLQSLIEHPHKETHLPMRGLSDEDVRWRCPNSALKIWICRPTSLCFWRYMWSYSYICIFVCYLMTWVISQCWENPLRGDIPHSVRNNLIMRMPLRNNSKCITTFFREFNATVGQTFLS